MPSSFPACVRATCFLLQVRSVRLRRDRIVVALEHKVRGAGTYV